MRGITTSTSCESWADQVIERGRQWPVAVRAMSKGGVDAVLDAALLGIDVLDAIRPGGLALLVRPPADRFPGGAAVVVQMVDSYRDASKLERLARWTAERRLTMRVADVVAPEETVTVHWRLECGGVRGRLVVDFS
jgi:NADPH:quinone reductase